MDLLKPYLPGAAGNPNYHAHGGSLYALGLIHTNTKDQKILTYLIEAIKNPGNNQNEQIIHGACLGIGLVGMGSGDESKFFEVIFFK
jgi:26S proteasome regulatory subunit N2